MIKLLIINDSKSIVDEIKKEVHGGDQAYNVTTVCDCSSLEKQLSTEDWDVVITGYMFGDLVCGEIINIIRHENRHLPIVVVAGREYAHEVIGLMKQGLVSDYVDPDNLFRLGGVLVREKAHRDHMRFRYNLEEKVQYLSYHDPLTNVLNRSEFENSLIEAINYVRESGRHYALYIIDIFQFKLINDTCSHQAGDLLLIEVANCLKPFAEGNGWLARVGGDEFALLVQMGDCSKAFDIARQIKADIHCKPFQWQGQQFEIEVSIGFSVIEKASYSAQEQITCANAACHASKLQSSERIVQFHPEDQAFDEHKTDMQWPQRLKRAIEQDEFVLFHQPMANLQYDSLPHTEFLLRMKCADRLLSPAEFIPPAERYRMMSHVDLWVIEHVFEYIKQCAASSREMVCFINLSGSSISDEAFFSKIKKLQKYYGVNPENVCFEITETAAIDKLTDAVDFINDIRGRGFRFALDDFGVGLSSFAYLKSIPVDYLKIDGSFVRNLLQNPIDYGIVEACNRVAHAAGLKTIAEFVETQQQRKAITDIGVDYAQGYGIMKPGPIPLPN